MSEEGIKVSARPIFVLTCYYYYDYYYYDYYYYYYTLLIGGILVLSKRL